MISSFKWAINGIVRTVKTQRNMRIHLCFAFYVLLAGLVTGLSAAEWGVVLVCIGLVAGLELVNTAIETLADRVTGERDEMIGAVKDAAAGAVLVCALMCAAAGCVIFFGGGHPAAAWAFACAHPVAAALIVLTLIPALLFVRGKKSK